MEQRIIQSFGRRRSHGLSVTQKNNLIELYKKYGIELPTKTQNPEDFFKNSQYSAIFMEIGFGGGEHLIENAIRNPNIAFIGCEPFENGIVNVLRQVSDNNIDNIRVYNGDARYLLAQTADGTIDRFYVLFPDPWPKKRHNKRRLLSEEFITRTLYHKLKGNGLVVIATDSEEYMQNVVEVVKKANDKFSANALDLEELQTRPQDFIATRYEQKAIEKGKRPFYLSLKRTLP